MRLLRLCSSSIQELPRLECQAPLDTACRDDQVCQGLLRQLLIQACSRDQACLQLVCLQRQMSEATQVVRAHTLDSTDTGSTGSMRLHRDHRRLQRHHLVQDCHLARKSVRLLLRLASAAATTATLLQLQITRHSLCTTSLLTNPRQHQPLALVCCHQAAWEASVAAWATTAVAWVVA